MQTRGDADLGQEAVGTQHRRQFRMQNLDRDVALVAEVAREVDGRHPAAPRAPGRCGSARRARPGNVAPRARTASGIAGAAACPALMSGRSHSPTRRSSSARVTASPLHARVVQGGSLGRIGVQRPVDQRLEGLPALRRDRRRHGGSPSPALMRLTRRAGAYAPSTSRAAPCGR